jgi:membrane-associated phospholipid phosphatase
MSAALLALVLLAPPGFLAKERFLADAQALVPKKEEVPKVLAVVVLTAAATQVDRSPSRSFRAHAPAFLSSFEPLGRYGVGNLLGVAFLSWGWAQRDAGLASAGVAFLEANWAASLLVSGVQSLSGRQRPGQPREGRFRHGGSSFPSAHAAHAFAWASVAYTSFPTFRWRFLSPAVASAVALSRVADGKLCRRGLWLFRGLVGGEPPGPIRPPACPLPGHGGQPFPRGFPQASLTNLLV